MGMTIADVLEPYGLKESDLEDDVKEILSKALGEVPQQEGAQQGAASGEAAEGENAGGQEKSTVAKALSTVVQGLAKSPGQLAKFLHHLSKQGGKKGKTKDEDEEEDEDGDEDEEGGGDEEDVTEAEIRKAMKELGMHDEQEDDGDEEEGKLDKSLSEDPDLATFVAADELIGALLKSTEKAFGTMQEETRKRIAALTSKVAELSKSVEAIAAAPTPRIPSAVGIERQFSAPGSGATPDAEVQKIKDNVLTAFSKGLVDVERASVLRLLAGTDQWANVKDEYDRLVEQLQQSSSSPQPQ